MEYIQCSHCNKKYGINDKVRAAVGHTIACKACGEPFEIELFETPSPSMPEANQATVEKKQVNEAVKETNNAKPEHTQRKRRRAQPTSEPATKKKSSLPMLLGITIVILSTYMFYHDRNINIVKPFVPTELSSPSAYISSHPAIKFQQ